MAKTLLNFRRRNINTLNPLSLSGSALQNKTTYHSLPEAQVNSLAGCSLFSRVSRRTCYFAHLPPSSPLKSTVILFTPLCQIFAGNGTNMEK